MFPKYGDKLDSPAIVTPQNLIQYHQDNGNFPPCDPPRSVIFLFQPQPMEYVPREYNVESFDQLLGEFFLLRDLDRPVGVVGNFGIGAPVTALQMELLIAWGVEQFVIAGAAGALQPDLNIGDIVIPDRAIRDEGTSHHYLPPAHEIEATPAILDGIMTECDVENATRGPTWTTDAIFRETVDEIREYRERGVQTVDMEAATVFAIADYRDVSAGAVFTISDILANDSWMPHFHDLDEDLERAFDIALGVCT